MVNLGRVLEEKGQYQEALVYLKNGLAIREKVLEEGHPDTVSALAWIGVSNRWQTKVPEVLRCMVLRSMPMLFCVLCFVFCCLCRRSLHRGLLSSFAAATAGGGLVSRLLSPLPPFFGALVD